MRNSERKRGKSGREVELSRRAFLGSAAAIAVAGGVLGAPGAREAQAKPKPNPGGGGIDPAAGGRRRSQAFRARMEAATFNLQLPVPDHPVNGDEDLYPNRIGNFSKGLPHNNFGEVDGPAYDALLKACASGRPADFEAIPMGCPNPSQQRKLTNPQAGMAFDLEGTDSHQFAVRAAPAFASAEEAGESVELYWMALLRDVAFTDYATSPLAQQAADDLSAMSDFRGPKVGGNVTPATLFRENVPGGLTGPWISQFLWRPTPFGAEFVERRMRTVLPGIDFITGASDWLDVQKGCKPSVASQFDPVRRYIRNGRDLAQWVRIDVLFQAYFDAMLILLQPPDPSDPVTGGGLGCPLNPGNPYLGSQTQDGFGTFGGPYIATILAEVSTRALKSVWYQKWFVHRRLRPEAFGGRVHHKIANGRPYPIHDDVLNSDAVAEVFSKYGTYFLPQAYPEGSPLHPSFGAGHATVAGACVTVLKALFDETFVIPNPVVPSADGLSLDPYAGPDAGSLTVGGELNKLAVNVATARNIAGIHWRTDGIESMRLGEAVAISVLRDQRGCYNEDFGGFTFTKFDGTTITV